MPVVLSNTSVIPNPCKGEESFYYEKISPGVYPEPAEGVEMTLVVGYLSSIYNSYSGYSPFYKIS